MAFTKPTIEIVNGVAFSILDQKLDLNAIQKKFPKVEYNPEQFPDVIFRLSNPKTSTLLFRTGRMLCTGAKTEKDVHRSINNIHSMLEEKGLML